MLCWRCGLIGKIFIVIKYYYVTIKLIGVLLFSFLLLTLGWNVLVIVVVVVVIILVGSGLGGFSRWGGSRSSDWNGSG